MSILIFNGSPRKEGNTHHLLQKMAEALQHSSTEFEIINLAQLDIHPCIACGQCESAGVCIFNDDMTELYAKCTDADTIVLASPVYFYHVTAQTKSFIDRCQVFWSRKYILKRPHPAMKRGFLVSVAATRGMRIFEGIELTAKYFFDALDCTYEDAFLAKEYDEAGAVLSSSELMEKAYDFGATLAGK